MYKYIMRRTQIYLSDEQHRALGRASRATGVTLSELVRRAVEERYVYRRRSKEDVLEALRASAGAWKGRKLTGEEYVERIRSGRRLAELYRR